jgi:hypothetical protein
MLPERGKISITSVLGCLFPSLMTAVHIELYCYHTIISHTVPTTVRTFVTSWDELHCWCQSVFRVVGRLIRAGSISPSSTVLSLPRFRRCTVRVMWHSEVCCTCYVARLWRREMRAWVWCENLKEISTFEDQDMYGSFNIKMGVKETERESRLASSGSE